LKRALAFTVPFFLCAGVATFTACGSKTGLLVPPDEADASPDVQPDTSTGADASEEGRPDADAGLDAPPDVQFRDVSPVDICPDAGSTLVYLLSSDNTLWSFYPPTLALMPIGTLDCNDPSSSPYSMAVDRRGIAYSVFTDGLLFRVDTASAACLPTPFAAGQDQFVTFGMAFVANTGGDAGETLYVDEGNVAAKTTPSRGLASIDTTSFVLNYVAAFTPPILGAELTGTSDGRLFAFYTNGTGSGSHIDQVDRTTGNILADNPLQVGTPNDGYAFAFWGGQFWVFTSSASQTIVTSFDPVTKIETPTTTWTNVEVVGAGVSTCAPQ
jgi:predicted small lipoprotein YifL